MTDAPVQAAPPPHPIRIVLVEPSPIYREALRRVLASEADFHIVATAPDTAAAVKLLAEHDPDILLLVLRELGEGALEPLKEIQASGSKARMILLASRLEKRQVVAALRLGAQGVVLAQSNAGLLFKSIRRVMAGECWVDRGMIMDLVQSLRETPAKPEGPAVDRRFNLTPREREIVERIVDGCSNGDIAKQFGISEQTVKHHLTNVFAKFGVSNRLELAMRASQRPVEG